MAWPVLRRSGARKTRRARRAMNQSALFLPACRLRPAHLEGPMLTLTLLSSPRPDWPDPPLRPSSRFRRTRSRRDCPRPSFLLAIRPPAALAVNVSRSALPALPPPAMPDYWPCTFSGCDEAFLDYSTRKRHERLDHWTLIRLFVKDEGAFRPGSSSLRSRRLGARADTAALRARCLVLSQ